jgi:uncharacterized protein
MKYLTKYQGSIAEICEKHQVECLYAFGSVLNQRFRENSDIDFLVKFGHIDLYDYFDNYYELKEKLQELLHREVDLVEEQTLKNVTLIHSINQNKLLIYGRASD